MCYVHNQWYDISCATLYFDVKLMPFSSFYATHYVLATVRVLLF